MDHGAAPPLAPGRLPVTIVLARRAEPVPQGEGMEAVKILEFSVRNSSA